MLLFVIYWSCLIAVCLFAWRSGGQDERAGASIMFLGSLATVLAKGPLPITLGNGEWSLPVVDLSVLAGFIILTLRSPRIWPIWASGFHVVAVATHLANFTKPDIVPRAYALAQGFWAYPMLTAIVLGTITYRRIAVAGGREQR
jgi:hypothetical protein